jgi:hypothetical protein
MKESEWECDYCLLPKLKMEVKKQGLHCTVPCGNACPWRKNGILPLIEDAQQKEHDNGERKPPCHAVDYSIIVTAAKKWLEKDV